MNYNDVVFGDIVELITNKVNASEISLYNYISTDNMLPNRGGVTYASSLPAANKFNAFSETDTLFSNIRTYFRKVWFAGFSGGASADVLIFRSKNSSFLDPHFLYYVASNKTFVDYTDLTSKGAKMPRGDKDAIAKFPLKLPQISDQKAIASVLGTLDDKIENNRRMNETLEEMARTIFKSWFVDFDPVHAKAAGNVPAHMDADTAALFPSSFGDDGLPEGWDNKTLGDVCKITSGKRPPTKMTAPDNENNISVYGGNGVAWYTNKVLFEPPFIITGRVGTLGTVYRVYEKCWVSDNALCCFPSNKDALELIYFAMKEIDYQSLNSGSTQPLLTQTTLKSQNIIAPSKEVALAFHQNMEILFKKVLANDEENQTLADLRDTLLPKLMSGEIRVADAEHEVEAAL